MCVIELKVQSKYTNASYIFEVIRWAKGGNKYHPGQNDRKAKKNRLYTIDSETVLLKAK